jgi:adenosine kinase
VVLAAVGRDGGDYVDRLAALGIDTASVLRCEDLYTAQAFITTDLADNQITAFHPGAMSFAHHNSVPQDQGIRLGLISPDGKDGMIQHAAECVRAGIPFIFDPGQGLPMFNGEELLDFIEKASWVTVNDYESQLLQERTGLSLTALAEKVEALIVTRGAQGSVIHVGGECIDIPPATPRRAVDPTGCGDAYRAGLVYGLMENLDWPTTGRIASLLGAIKVECYGTQNHGFTLATFKQRYRETYGESF